MDVPCVVLSELSQSQLRKEAVGIAFPKWHTMCSLRLMKLSTLDALLVLPGAQYPDYAAAASQFAQRLGCQCLQVRSDGGIEKGHYFTGGMSVDVERAVDLTADLLDMERAVMLLEPTNRFLNQLSVNLGLYREGGMVIELLGPGYDVADINRGRITPQIRLDLPLVSWELHTDIWKSDIRTQVSFREDTIRIAARLQAIGETILPQMGVDLGPDTPAATEGWLRAHGFVDLWQGWRPTITLQQVREWYDVAFSVGMHFKGRSRWDVLTMSGSDLGGRFVWWDIVNGSRKLQVSP